jgi:hypothetical protein
MVKNQDPHVFQKTVVKMNILSILGGYPRPPCPRIAGYKELKLEIW